MEFKVRTKSEAETIQLAQSFIKRKFPNLIICLEGDLGSGKTIFAKGVGAALGVTEVITSPTFNIIKEYLTGIIPFYHIDVYRLHGELENIDLDSYFEKNGLVIIEWADLIKEQLPLARLDIKIKVINETSRLFIIKPLGLKYVELCEDVL